MPRDGLQQYAPPPGTQGVANYTIESARYNTFVADITADQNNPRPIVAGGTGAATARDAMIALGGEIAMQGPVTNFDSFPFVAGSFWCAANATSAPTTARFSGNCTVINDGSGDVTLEMANPGAPTTKYRRRKLSGVWQAWELLPGSAADLDAAYVNVAGDTMTGPLTVGGAGFVGSGSWPFVVHMATNVNFAMLNNAGEAYVGSFVDAAGAAPLALVGSVIRMPGPLKCEANITTGSSSTTGTYYFGNSGAKYLQYDGTNFTLNGGPLYTQALDVTGDITAHYSATAGTYKFGQAGTKYLTYDGSAFHFNGGSVFVEGSMNIYASSHVSNGGTYTGYSTTNTGVYIFGNDGTRTLSCSGPLFTIAGAPFAIQPGGSTVPGTNGALRIGFMGGGSQYGIVTRPAADNTYQWLITNSAETSIGSVTTTPSATTFNTTSDERLKDVKGAYTPDDAIAIIRADPVMSFTWKATGDDAIGWIAQRSYAVDPNLATPPPTDIAPADEGTEPIKLMWGIDYGRRTPYLWAAVSQLLDRIDVLEAKIAAMEAAG